MRLITSTQYGYFMRQQRISWPAPAIRAADVTLPDVRVYRIARRGVIQVFVLARRNWATVYARPSYSEYRKAFDDVMPRTSLGEQVDHLMPKSKAKAGEYLALGRIGSKSNIGWNDDQTYRAMAQKVGNTTTGQPHSYVSRLTDMERGWAVVRCYIRPISELDQGNLTEVNGADLAAKLEHSVT